MLALDLPFGVADDRAVVRSPRTLRPRQARLSALVALVLVVVSACISTHGPASNLTESQKLQAQAQADLTRWADAIAATPTSKAVVFVGDLTDQVGDWERSVGDNNKPALMGGLIEAAVDLPATSGEGIVTWQDGTTMSVPVVSAQEAVSAIQADAPSAGDLEEGCPNCARLEITGAQLISGPATTSRGSAIVPIWEFALRGTAVRVTRVAIADPVRVAPPPWTGVPWGDSGDAPVGISIDSAIAAPDGRQLTVSFVGVPQSADQVCGADYTGEAVESSLAIVVIVTAHPNEAPAACPTVGAYRTAAVTLSSPLGDRTVLEVTMGRPVPVRLTP